MMSKIKNIAKILFICGLIGLSSVHTLSVNAEERNASISDTGFDYANGHSEFMITVNGKRAMCVEYGFPFKSAVDDLINVVANGKELSNFPNSIDDWVGWGTWDYDDNTTHTLTMSELSQTSSSNVPSAESNTSSAGSKNSGTKEKYSVVLTNDFLQPWTTGQKNALSVIKYYCPSEDLQQVLTWAIEKNHITVTEIHNGENTFVKMKFSSECDDYVRGFLNPNDGRYYELFKEYRAFVWKVTNWTQIPSFSSASNRGAILKKIHLKWDADLYGTNNGGYTATINDENGVLKYFDFSNAFGSGITAVDNGNGTLTISTKQKIVGTKVNAINSVTSDGILPSDGNFYSTYFWRWKLEGVKVSNKKANGKPFTYTYLKPLPSTTHDHDWSCEWKCTNGGSVTNCNGDINAGWTSNSCSCDLGEGEYCTTDHGGHYTYHSHTTDCYHRYYCSYCSSPGTGEPSDDCSVSWTCTEQHYETKTGTIDGTYIDWQDVSTFENRDKPMQDPPYCYVALVTDEHDFPAKTDVDIKLIDQNGNEVDHIKIGEKYKVRYIYTYEGASKGFTINTFNESKPYYEFTYLARMTTDAAIKNSKGSYASGSTSVKTSSLILNKTPIKILGTYTTIETPYPDKTYTFNSGNTWNDKIYLDALTTDNAYDNYNNKSESEIVNSSENSSVQKKKVEVKKQNDKIKVVWTYESDYEVFTSGVINATAYIEVGKDKNNTKTYFDEKYNYGELSDHNNVGDDGFFSEVKNGKVVYTQNNEYVTYALKNNVWQSDVEVETSNPVLNTGAGITQHIYSASNAAYHNVNYNLYYTIKVSNPTAHIYWNKVTQANNQTTPTETKNESSVNTSSDTYEFDLNTLISWGASGSTLAPFNGSTVVVDHVKTGTTYLQRTIPTRLTTLKSGTAKMTAKVYPNYDRLIYEDAYNGITETGTANAKRLKLTVDSRHYPTNEVSTESKIYSAMNPKVAKPTNIQNTNNYNNVSTFNIVLSNGANTKIHDRLTKSYTEYKFIFNNGKLDNKVKFSSPRQSIVFFKYSNTSYDYNGKTVNGTVGTLNSGSKSQTEKYYISQVLFKSNYTTKYQKELEKQGADYVVEEKANGQKDVWIDMVNDNKYAIVSAGQGFELKVTVKYENSLLTQYLARYFGYNDAQNTSIGSSGYLGPQYCNISSMTGILSGHAYINGYNTIDRLATNLVTGSNVYKDLYTYMSDNPETVYSYTGMYETPIIYDQKVEYSNDFSVTTITYTMKKSTENGVVSNYQNMKFFTNQLAPDAKTPGIVNSGNKANGTHSITLWTPIVAATPFDYPSAAQDRYIGDAIELGYTIKSTGADDSIVHIVQ